MTTFMILLGIAAIAVVVILDVVAIRRDGYGSTPPPRSHNDWDRTDPVGGRRLF